MNESIHLFNLLTAEEACFVSGGFTSSNSNNMPYAMFSTTEPTQEMQIVNADGHGQKASVPLSGSGKKTTTETTNGLYVELGIPSTWSVNNS
ncbi:MAG TPA: hypothetical protein IGS40_09455 [Trichormus sp. M33_DOE_039]|nr:hypothetical protein [Trichormus sp. M33_DOE_039]